MRAQDSEEQRPRSLTVLVTAVSSVMGGGITVVQNLTRQMAKCRPDCRFVLYCSHRDVAEFDYPENVEVVFLPRLLSRPARWLWEQRHFPALAEARRADVVLALGGYLSFRTRAPQVAVWQNPNVFTPPGIPRPLRERLLILVQRVIQGASMKRAAQNVFLTQTSVELASKYWNLDRIRRRVIHSGVDASRVVAQNAPPLDKREKLVVTVGHTYSHKNYETMIDAIGVYRDRYDEPLRLRIIGAPANPAYFSELERRIVDRDLSGLVEMSGGAPHDDVIETMSRAAVYLVTSQLETFGLTMFEAMGQGLPVVASDATCHPEVCGDAALYCDPHDAEDVAQKVHRVVTEDGLAERLRAKGFERLESFSWERTALGYLEVLEEAAAGVPR